MISNFPLVDPIPLPAPLWLFKGLHVLTLGLHFVALQLFLGGLIFALLMTLRGCLSQNSKRAESLTLAGIIGRRLTIVMTFVINLGVPPLLFAQVLYGRAIYTSSVLIGSYWIAVIPLLIACYWFLYKFSWSLESGRNAWWYGFSSLVLACCIAKIYSTNMTLMIHPESWKQLYINSPSGSVLATIDPTIAYRLLTMFCGAMMASGLWMLWLAPSRHFEASTRANLQNLGGKIAILFAVLYAIAALQVVHNQPQIVVDGLRDNAIYHGAGCVGLLLLGCIVLLGASAVWMQNISSLVIRWGAGLLGLLATLSFTVVRDGIRDLTLKQAGYDVWDRVEATNWSIVIIFLVLFVAGLATLGWLVRVMIQAKAVKEEVAI